MRDVLVVVYDGVALLDVAGPVEVFQGAGRYRVGLASLGGRDVRATGLVRLGVDIDLAGVRQAPDTLLVAGGLNYQQGVGQPELLAALRRLAPGCRRVASVCTGAFLLAEAGLLAGRRATTHWAFCAELAERHPDIRVEPDAIFVRDGQVATSAGVTAGIDLSLALVEDDHGPELTRDLAKSLVVFMQRPGGQSQFSIRTAVGRAQTPALRGLLDEIALDPGRDFSLAAMARRLAVSPRHVSRLFAAETGTSPGRYLEAARVEAARAQLEGGDDGMDTIAKRCGFVTAETMRRAFLKEIGVPPSAYRARFRHT